MWVKALLLFLVFSFVFQPDHSFDQDLGRHLKLGEIIWQTHLVPKTNLFSFTNPDFPFINTHWLFEVIAYTFSVSVGLYAFLVLKIFIFLISVLLIIKIIPKEDSTLLVPIGLIFLLSLRQRVELRPEIFSFFYTALTYFILEKFLKKSTKWVYVLPLISLFWINTHIYFFVGLILQAIFIIHLGLHLRGVKLKLLSFIFVLSVVASLINPNFLQGFLYPLFVNQNYGYAIEENQTMFFLEKIGFNNPNYLFAKASLIISLISLVIAFFRKRLQLKNILLVFFGAGLALLNVRGFPYLFFLSMPAVLFNIGPIKKSAITYTILIVFIPLVIYLTFINLEHTSGLSFIKNGEGAMDFAIKNELPSSIFNNFDIGSYILYRGYPKFKPFVDGRPEAYPKEFFSDTYIPMQSDLNKFKHEETKWGIKTIIFSHTDLTPWAASFLQSISKEKDWKMVYVDDFIVIFVKADVANQKNLKILNP